MPYRDLNSFLAALSDRGELVRVTEEIQNGHEIYCILWELYRQKGPAVVFESVRGTEMPIVANLLGSLDRFALACGFPTGRTRREYAHLFRDILERGHWKPPRKVSEAPCQEMVLTGDDVDLTELPIFQWHPRDGGPYITLPLVIANDPELGTNVGTYRMMVHGKRECSVLSDIFQHQGIYLERARRAGKRGLPCAVVIGADPAVHVAASTKLPLGKSEFEFASALRGDEPVEVVRCVSIDIEVPASAQIVLEGEVSTEERREEGPFGEWMGYFEEAMRAPVFRITAITRRRNPYYLTTTEVYPGGEGDNFRLGSTANFLASAKTYVAGFKDAWLPTEGRGYVAVVAIRKHYPGWGKIALQQTFAIPYVASIANYVVVVDEDIDPSDWEQVMWAIATRCDPTYDVMITPPAGTSALSPSASVRLSLTHGREIAMISKLGIDATTKVPGEGRQRPPSVRVRPPDDILSAVQAKWANYGLPPLKTS